MSDLAFYQIKHLAPITAVDLLNATTRSAVIYGSGFSNVEKVIFAGIEITSFVVRGSGEITFTLPPPPMDLARPVKVIVSSEVPNSLGQSVVGRIDTSSKASGSGLVIQRFLKILLTEKGSNFFNPSQGTNLVSMLKSSSPSSHMVRNYVSDATTQVLNVQDEDLLPPDETLENVNVISSYFDPRRASINIELEIITADGVARLTEVTA